MEDYELPFEEKLKLLTDKITEISIKYGIEPSNKIFDHFILRADGPYIYRTIKGELDNDIMTDCNTAYRHYFPEGR